MAETTYFPRRLILAGAMISGVLLALAVHMLGVSFGLDLGGLWRSDTREFMPAGAAMAWWLIATRRLLRRLFHRDADASAVSGQIPQRMRQFLIAVGVLVLAGRGPGGLRAKPDPDDIGRARGSRGAVPRRGDGVLRRAFCAAQGMSPQRRKLRAERDFLHPLPRCDLAAPRQIAAAAASSRQAEMTSDTCAPAMKAVGLTDQRAEQRDPSTLPVCRVALSTPAAMPERDFSTLPSSVDVSGGTSRPRPPPMTISCAHDCPIAGARLDSEQRQTSERRQRRASGDRRRRADSFGHARRDAG